MKATILVGAVVSCLCAVAVCAQNSAKTTNEVADIQTHIVQVPALPQIVFEGLARACAGGLNSDVHRFRLRLKLGRVLLPNETLELRFDHNRGHDYGDGRPRKTAKLRKMGGAWSETLRASPNANRVLDVEVLSSDIVCKMRLVAFVNDTEIGSVWCDFGAAESYRRFPDPFLSAGDYGDELDTGWLFYGDYYPPGNIVKAKTYLKFKIDVTLGDINGNWKVVNGHKLEVRIDEIKINNEGRKPDQSLTKLADITPYTVVLRPDNAKKGTRTVTTRRDGSASVEMRAGTKVADEIYSVAYDQSQWDDEQKDAPKPPQTSPTWKLEDVNPEGAPVEWFAPPEGLRGFVIYGEGKAYQNQTKFWRHQIGESSTGNDRLVISLPNSYNLRLSPDGKKASFHVVRDSQYMDGCHDLYVGDLQSGALTLVREQLFQDSERWSSDSKHLAYISGSMEPIFSNVLDANVYAAIYDLNSAKERNVFSNSSLYEQTLAWSPNGDLFFAIPIPTKTTGRRPVLYRVRASASKAEEMQRGVWRVLPSPDGQHIAYFGPEDLKSPEILSPYLAKPNGAALSVMRADGSGHKSLNRESGDYPDLLWASDNAHLLAFDRTTLREWDIATRHFREVAHIETSKLQTPDDYKGHAVYLNGLTKDGRYVFIIDEQRQSDPKDTNSYLITRVWYALDLQNGALHKLAIFRGGDFDWHDESK